MALSLGLLPPPSPPCSPSCQLLIEPFLASRRCEFLQNDPGLHSLLVASRNSAPVALYRPECSCRRSNPNSGNACDNEGFNSGIKSKPIAAETRSIYMAKLANKFAKRSDEKTGNKLVGNVAGSSVEAHTMEARWQEAMGKIRRLQNGSDIRGIAVEGEKGREVNLTPAAAFYLGAAFGEWVAHSAAKSASKLRISIGRDPRISGPSLLAAMAAGLQSIGCSVFDMNIATTPACFMSTILPEFAYDGSIMLTASHLPYTRNGMKFFTSNGGLNVSDIESICNVAALNSVKFPDRYQRADRATAKKVDFMPAYAAHLRDIIKKGVNHPEHYDHPLQGFKVAVNAGNGSGGFFAAYVLEKLGADTTASLNLEPDGMFPNHIPNPEDKKAMAVTRATVIENTADLGVVFDTDVDRSGVVGSSGNVINGDRLIALMASIVLAEHPDSLIVTDARTSDGLSKFITERGGTHCLYRVGYRNVINKGIELNKFGADTHLMMETSGHGAMKENYFLDDGAYMAVKIIIEMVRMRLRGSNEGIGALIKDLEEPKDNIELRVNIQAKPEDVKVRGGEVIEAFRKFVVEGKAAGWRLGECGDCWVSDGCLADFEDGESPALSQKKSYQPPSGIDAHMYRAQIYDEETGASGWVHMRQSIHNPNFAINMQSSEPNGCLKLAKILLERFFMFDNNARELDISELEKFVIGGAKQK